MVRSRTGLLPVLLLALAVMPVGQVGAQEGDCGGPPAMAPLTFEQPDVFDTVRAGGEPSVEGHPDGTLLYAAHASTTLFFRDNMPDPDYVTPYTGATYVWRSTDGGDNWRYVGLAGTEVGPHATVSGFSDPDFAIDAAGNVYTSGINLANVYVAKSEDSGATWVGHPFGTVATDREWLAADEENVVYLNGNQIPGGRRLWKSKDGGLTFDLANPVQLPGGGPPNKPEVDKSDGRLYFPDGGGSMAIYPNARQDDFTLVETDIPDGTPSAHGFLNDMAIDKAGNVYVVSNTEKQIQVSYSTDRGQSFTTQVVHDAGDNEVLWPWISAGEDGRVGVSWFQADRPVPNTESVSADYRVHAAQTITGHGWTDDCGNERPPVWDTAVATPEPFHQGTICSSGTTCQIGGIDRRLGDYHTNSISADGKLLIAYSDTSVKPEGAISHPGFIRQSGGVDFIDEGPDPSEVGGLSATVAGTSVSASGAATFGGQAPQTIAEDIAGDGPVNPEVSRDTGVDLTGARAYQPDPEDPTLVFEWKVTNLPASGTYAEAVRYFWPFQIATPDGPKSYFLQAKLSNLSSVTTVDDPAGHVTNAGRSFQLRGNCVDDWMGTGIANCPHIGWLDGEFDTATNTVRMELPLGSELAPEVVPGAKLEALNFAGGTIAVAYQAVVSNATTTDFAEWFEDDPYNVPSKRVSLGVAPAGTPPNQVDFSTEGTLSDDGSFLGNVDISGLEPGSYELFARACFGSNCGLDRTPFTIV